MSRCFIATGVRWAESVRRNNTRGIMEISHRNKEKRIILTSDNDEKRQLFETCNLKGKMTVNPIVDWSNADVWGYIHSESLPINPLYQCGFERVGCVGCPLGGYKHQCMDFARYPKFKKAYIMAFQRMLDNRQRLQMPNDIARWKTGEDVFHWWTEDGVLPGQLSMDDLMEDNNV